MLNKYKAKQVISGLKRTWSRDLGWLYADQLLSVFASTAGTFILSWLLCDITGSKLAMGGLWLLSMSSQWIVQLILGPFIDRWKRTTMMKFSEMVRALIYLFVALMWIVGERQAYVLYIATFVSSVVVYDFAASALLPKLALPNQLIKVNASISGSVQLVRMAAMPLAGLAVELWDAGVFLPVIMLLFTFSYGMLTQIREEPHKRDNRQQSWMKQFKQGSSVYIENSNMLAMALFISVTSFGVTATQAMYIPYVSDVLNGGSLEYGWFSASFPLGYVLGSWVAGRIKHSTPHFRKIMLGALLVGGVTYVLLAITRSIPAALIIELAAGMAMPFWNVFSSTLYYRLVPEAVLGQVLSIRYLLTRAAGPLGIVYGTFCATAYGVPMLFFTVGLLIVLVTGIGLLSPIVQPHKASGSDSSIP